jgi:hypothetical protein
MSSLGIKLFGRWTESLPRQCPIFADRQTFFKATAGAFEQFRPMLFKFPGGYPDGAPVCLTWNPVRLPGGDKWQTWNAVRLPCHLASLPGSVVFLSGAAVGLPCDPVFLPWRVVSLPWSRKSLPWNAVILQWMLVFNKLRRIFPSGGCDWSKNDTCDSTLVFGKNAIFAK